MTSNACKGIDKGNNDTWCENLKKNNDNVGFFDKIIKKQYWNGLPKDVKKNITNDTKCILRVDYGAHSSGDCSYFGNEWTWLGKDTGFFKPEPYFYCQRKCVSLGDGGDVTPKTKEVVEGVKLLTNDLLLSFKDWGFTTEVWESFKTAYTDRIIYSLINITPLKRFKMSQVNLITARAHKYLKYQQTWINTMQSNAWKWFSPEKMPESARKFTTFCFIKGFEQIPFNTILNEKIWKNICLNCVQCPLYYDIDGAKKCKDYLKPYPLYGKIMRVNTPWKKIKSYNLGPPDGPFQKLNCASGNPFCEVVEKTPMQPINPAVEPAMWVNPSRVDPNSIPMRVRPNTSKPKKDNDYWYRFLLWLNEHELSLNEFELIILFGVPLTYYSLKNGKPLLPIAYFPVALFGKYAYNLLLNKIWNSKKITTFIDDVISDVNDFEAALKALKRVAEVGLIGGALMVGITFLGTQFVLIQPYTLLADIVIGGAVLIYSGIEFLPFVVPKLF